jgi:hypothetical protein
VDERLVRRILESDGRGDIRNDLQDDVPRVAALARACASREVRTGSLGRVANWRAADQDRGNRCERPAATRSPTRARRSRSWTELAERGHDLAVIRSRRIKGSCRRHGERRTT